MSGWSTGWSGNARGSSEDRRRRREWLVETYRADVGFALRRLYLDGHLEVTSSPFTDAAGVPDFGAGQAYWLRVIDRQHEDHARLLPPNDPTPELDLVGVTIEPSCRCYRCGCLLIVDTVTVDRIIPGCKGGTYRRNNIRPACGPCNSETGGRTRA